MCERHLGKLSIPHFGSRCEVHLDFLLASLLSGLLIFRSQIIPYGPDVAMITHLVIVVLPWSTSPNFLGPTEGNRCVSSRMPMGSCYRPEPLLRLSSAICLGSHVSQIGILRAQVEERGNGLNVVREENARLRDGLSTYQKEAERLQSENKILKRAVAIQNTKGKEVNEPGWCME